MAEQTTIGLELVPLESVPAKCAVLGAGIVQLQLGKHPRQRRDKVGKGMILLLREVVLVEPAALHEAHDHLVPRWACHEVLGADAGLLDRFRKPDPDTLRIPAVPLRQHLAVRRAVGTDVGNLDPDRTVVGCACVPGTFLEVEGLVDGAVDVQHEVHRQAASVLEDLEAPPRCAADVVVDHELGDGLLQFRQRPAPQGDPLQHRFLESLAERAVARTLRQPLSLGLADLVGEAQVGAVGVIAAWVVPQDHVRAGVKQLAADRDLVAATAQRVPWPHATGGDEDGAEDGADQEEGGS